MSFRATVKAYFDALESHAQSLGIFQRVNGHEPRNAPGSGLSCAIAIGPMVPVRSSGLAAVSMRVEFGARVYRPGKARELDDIDPDAAGAACDLMAAYCGDFDLGGLVRDVDIFGADGGGLQAQPGWLEQDGQEFRVVEVTLPLIVNDLFPEVA